MWHRGQTACSVVLTHVSFGLDSLWAAQDACSVVHVRNYVPLYEQQSPAHVLASPDLAGHVVSLHLTSPHTPQDLSRSMGALAKLNYRPNRCASLLCQAPGKLHLQAFTHYPTAQPGCASTLLLPGGCRLSVQALVIQQHQAACEA